MSTNHPTIKLQSQRTENRVGTDMPFKEQFCFIMETGWVDKDFKR